MKRIIPVLFSLSATAGTTQVPAGTDLAKLLSTASPDTTYQLAPKAVYAMSGTVTIGKPNVKIDLNGSSLAMTASPGASSNIAVRAPGFEIFNGSITKGLGGIRSWADHTYLHDLSFSGLTQQFFLGDVGSTNARLERITQKEATGSVPVYFVADNFTIKDSSLAEGSYGEYALREDIANGHIPTNALISNSTFKNPHNKYGKDAVGIRMGSAVIENCTIDPDLRVGQGSAPKGLGSTVPSVVVRDCTFPALRNPQLSLDEGIGLATIDGNTFATDANEVSMAISGNSKIVLTNNIRKLTDPKVTPKHFWGTTAKLTDVTESGTKIEGPAPPIDPCKGTQQK